METIERNDFVEESIYWEPESNTEGIYQQLTGKGFHEISREMIRLIYSTRPTMRICIKVHVLYIIHCVYNGPALQLQHNHYVSFNLVYTHVCFSHIDVIVVIE